MPADRHLECGAAAVTLVYLQTHRIDPFRIRRICSLHVISARIEFEREEKFDLPPTAEKTISSRWIQHGVTVDDQRVASVFYRAFRIILLRQSKDLDKSAMLSM